MDCSLRTRIAPTPSGFLHWGNAYSFILTWLVARQSLGTLRLRIDDLDAARTRHEYLEDIFHSLDWLGLDYDEGPRGPDDHRRRYSQRLRLDRYREVLDNLCHFDRVFACACSRRSIQRSPDQLHPAQCRQRHLPLDQRQSAWRLATQPDEVTAWIDADGTARSVSLHDRMRDFVVRRKDTLPAYQLTSLVDDVDFDINFIVRGEDLLPSTAAQRQLAQLTGKAQFSQARFLHHPLLKDTEGQKLSKSSGATSLQAMRRKHGSAGWLYRELSPHFGIPGTVDSATELLQAAKLPFLGPTRPS